GGALAAPPAARARPQPFQAIGSEADGDAAVARQPYVPHRRGRTRGEDRDGDAREQQRHERLDDGEAGRWSPIARHWTRTRPRWFTTMLRSEAPPRSVTVALSVVPSALKRTRPLTGRAEKGTPAGRASRASDAPFASRSSQRARPPSSWTSTGLPRSRARPRACRRAAERRCAAPPSRRLVSTSGRHSPPAPAIALRSARQTTSSSRLNPWIRSMHTSSASGRSEGET